MPEISIKAETIFHIGTFTVTNSVFLSVIVFAVLTVLALAVRAGLRSVPGKLQSLLELFLEQVLELMESVMGSRELAERYLPLIATVFLFIMVSNWFGLVPGVGSLGIYQTHISDANLSQRTLVPLFRAPAADFNFTLALAVISVLATNVLGVAAIGLRKHLGKFFTLKNPLFTFVGLLEFISEFVRIISFSFRLFGNIFAGEVLLTIIIFLAPYFIPLPFLFLEVFVGFIQAFIFAMLTLVFVSMAVNPNTEH